MHTFTRRNADAGGISTECSCGFYYETAGRDASSRSAVMTAELEHKNEAAS